MQPSKSLQVTTKSTFQITPSKTPNAPPSMASNCWLQQWKDHDDNQDHKIIEITKAMVGNSSLQQWKNHDDEQDHERLMVNN